MFDEFLQRLFSRRVKPAEQPLILKSWKRKFDSDTQQTRPPMKNRDEFNRIWSAAYGALLGQDARQAIELAERAIRMEPHRAAPWMVKAQAHALEGQTEQALRSIDRAITIDPSDPDKFELKASFLAGPALTVGARPSCYLHGQGFM
jgi:tetratricopeptide (TPR) repeat protein